MSTLDTSRIPRWRKAVFLCGFFATLASGAVLANNESSVYISGARTPRATSGEIYPVSVNHGSVRYLGPDEFGNYQAWKARFSLPMLPALFALITSRDSRQSVREGMS